jgi:hypothetical protein
LREHTLEKLLRAVRTGDVQGERAATWGDVDAELEEGAAATLELRDRMELAQTPRSGAEHEADAARQGDPLKGGGDESRQQLVALRAELGRAEGAGDRQGGHGIVLMMPGESGEDVPCSRVAPRR